MKSTLNISQSHLGVILCLIKRHSLTCKNHLEGNLNLQVQGSELLDYWRIIHNLLLGGNEIHKKPQSSSYTSLFFPSYNLNHSQTITIDHICLLFLIMLFPLYTG